MALPWDAPAAADVEQSLQCQWKPTNGKWSKHSGSSAADIGMLGQRLDDINLAAANHYGDLVRRVKKIEQHQREFHAFCIGSIQKLESRQGELLAEQGRLTETVAGLMQHVTSMRKQAQRQQ